MNVKLEPGSDSQAEREMEIPREPSTPILTAPPPPLIKSALEVDSPSIKRRQSRVEDSTPSIAQISPTKRVKSTKDNVKILPVKYEFCEVEDIVVLIANMISELIQTNDNLPLRSGVLTRFHSR